MNNQLIDVFDTLFRKIRRRVSKLDVRVKIAQLKSENDVYHTQLSQLTDSLLDQSFVFDEAVFRELNPMYSAGYTERTELSESYATKGEEEFFSCPDLQGTVHFMLDGLVACGYPHSGNRGCVRLGRFEGNRFPIELLLTARRRIVRDLNNGIDTPCTGCPQLQKRKWKPVAYPLKEVVINDWTACNLRCEYCYTLDLEEMGKYIGKRRTHDLQLLMEDMLRHRYLAPDAVVSWGGGDVTVYKPFEAVARLLIEHSIYQLVNTNAVLFSQTIADGLATKLMEVMVSVDAGTRETYTQVKGLDAFDRVWENIAKYASVGKVTVKYIIYDRNSSVENISRFIELCRRHNIPSVALAPENEHLAQKGFSDETLRNAALMIYQAQRARVPLKIIHPFPPQVQKQIDEYLAVLQRGGNN